MLRIASLPQLATMHPLLATRLPFMGTTSLLQAAWLQQSFFPGPESAESVGVVTFKKSALVGYESKIDPSRCPSKLIICPIDNEAFDECWGTP